ncbi:V-ATPase V1 sector subunit E, partial [Serendipita sp. 399]
MSSRAMNDEEVASEMNKMIAFIKQEAMEKAREIKVKANEDFAIEKTKIVRQESQAIDAAFDKKRKAAETALKMYVVHPRYIPIYSILIDELRRVYIFALVGMEQFAIDTDKQ